MMFELTDSEGDKLRVSGALGYGDRERLIVGCDDTDTGETVGVYVLRNDVIRLRDWLSQWLGEDPTPEPPATPAPLTAADVRAIASEVIAAALAQREAPAGATFCEIPGCPKFPATAKHFQHDPEPRDVGHPDGECTCHDAEGNSIRPVTLAEALADPTPAGLDTLWKGPCNQAIRPGTVLLSSCPDCGLMWAMHRAPARREDCALCGRVWSDGHGQPGDPCTGAPKQLVGCECGHRTALHDSRGCAGRKTGAVHLPCPCTVTR